VPGDDGQPQLIAEQRFMQTGERRDGWVVVSKGLQAGDQVVTAGQIKLDPGAAHPYQRRPGPQTCRAGAD
jgi:membrane fusion protein (multidrug efflux system)